MSAVLDFAKVAKRSGAADVYEVASRELEDVRDLGLLCLHLRRVDADWKMDGAEKKRLAYLLLDAGVAERHIRDQLDISQKTVARRREELADLAKQGRKPAFQSGVKRTKPEGASPTPCGPILHFSASSGNSDIGEILRTIRRPA